MRGFRGMMGYLISGVGIVTLVSSCASGSRAVVPLPPAPAPFTVAVVPGPDARDVSPSSPIHVDVTGGMLETVSLTSGEGHQIAGQVAPDRHTWNATDPLGYGTTYTWSGTAMGTDGRRVPVAGSFSTVTPAQQIHGTINIGDQQTVGVAAPITIDFDDHVQDRVAVEKALSVQASVPTDGSWAWLPDQDGHSRVHWRPKDYWKPGTNVTVNAALFGLPMGNGNYGKDNLSTHFTVGRAQIVKADVTSHQMLVLRDGQQTASYPASYGLDSSPDRNTRSGTHVVMGKAEDQRMTSAQYGYDVVEHWAVRISNNGEFIHANPATVGNQGSSNVTHGCVNLSTDNAKEYFDTALYGDPIEVTNSGVPLSEQDGDIYDWTIPWEKWRTLSALTP